MVREGDVVALVRDEGEALVVGELGEPRGVDGELDAVGPGGVGRRVLDAFEAERERREEGVPQDEAREGALHEVRLDHVPVPFRDGSAGGRRHRAGRRRGGRQAAPVYEARRAVIVSSMAAASTAALWRLLGSRRRSAGSSLARRRSISRAREERFSSPAMLSDGRRAQSSRTLPTRVLRKIFAGSERVVAMRETTVASR